MRISIDPEKCIMRALLFTAIAIISLFALTAQAKGSEWEKVGEDKEVRISIDLSSIRKLPHNHYRVWAEMVYKDPSHTAKKSLRYDEYDCDNKRNKILQIIVYLGDGSKKTINEEESWSYIPPDTIIELPFTLVCNNYRGNWEKIYENDKRKFYLDWDSLIKLPDKHYKVWEKIVDADNDPTSALKSAISYDEHDCVNKKTKSTLQVYFSRDGSPSIHTYQTWDDASNNIFLKAVCSKQSKGIEKTK